MENSSVAHGGIGMSIGLALASGTSLMLWLGLVQIARWTASAIF